MKTPRLFVLLLLFLLPAKLSAFYDPGQGRWLSRDQIQEVDGPNLYATCHNRPIDNYDHLGLWTEVQRRGGAWAEVCAEKGDTWSGLAESLTLRTSEASKWVKNFDSTPQPGKTYLVPNTVAVYTSNASKWISDSILSVAFRYRTEARVFAERKKAEGYNLLTSFNKANKGKFIEMWNAEGIYIIYFAGHGDKTSGYAAEQDPNLFVDASMVNPPYQLSQIHAMHCYSADKQDTGGLKPDGTTVFAEWSNHALRTYGFHGFATHLDLPSITFKK